MGPVTITLAAMAVTMAQDKAVDRPVAPPALVIPAPAPPQIEARPNGPNLPPTPRTRAALVISRDDYPNAALRENRSGDTSIELLISRWGTIADCMIVTSSGHADLDATTCDLLVRRSRFWPATDAQGNPIAGKHKQTVRWVLPEAAPPPPVRSVPPPIVSVSMPGAKQLFPAAPQAKIYTWAGLREADWPAGAQEAGRTGKTRVGFAIDTTGKVANCRVLQTSGHADLDARSCAIVRERAEFAPARGLDGLATQGRGEQEFDWKQQMPRVRPPAPNSPPDASLRSRPVMLPAFMGRPGEVTVRMVLGEDGKAMTCELEAKGGMVGISALEKSLCRDAREKGFRTLDPAKNPLPRKIEMTMEVKIVGKGG